MSALQGPDVKGGKPWEDATGGDIKASGKRGLERRRMAEIEALLAAK